MTWHNRLKTTGDGGTTTGDGKFIVWSTGLSMPALRVSG